MSDFELPNRGKDTRKNTPAPSVKEADLKIVEGEEPKKEATKPLYSQEELLRVFDEIMFSGDYAEDYVIKGRLPVTFKTRTGEDINAIQRSIDAAGFNLISSVETMRSLMNLQYSLVRYDKKDLTLMEPSERAKFVERLSGPMIAILLDTMGKFDHKVAEACKEGEANF